MEQAFLASLQNVASDAWHLDRPLVHGQVVQLRLIRRSREDVAAELAERTASLRGELARLDGWRGIFRRSRRQGLSARLAALSDRMSQYGPSLAAATDPRAALRARQFARPPDDADDDFGVSASLAYELAGRVLGMRPEAHTVLVNVYFEETDPATGHSLSPCVLAVTFDRESYADQVHTRVEAAVAVRGIFPYRSVLEHAKRELAAAVRPFEFPDGEEPALAEEEDAPITPQPTTSDEALEFESHIQFEVAVSSLLNALGLEASVVGGSGDQEIEFEAVDPRPLVGGHVVVHAKGRGAEASVDERDVRELHGVVARNRAIKGVLVTTGRIGDAAAQFAQGLPLTLVDGAELRRLLAGHDVTRLADAWDEPNGTTEEGALALDPHAAG